MKAKIIRNIPDAPAPTRIFCEPRKVKKRLNLETEGRKRPYKKPQGYRRYGSRVQKMWTPKEIEEVLKLKESGMMDKEIGAIYGVTAEAIEQLRRRERRKRSRTVGENT